jgi:hypothetical protein
MYRTERANMIKIIQRIKSHKMVDSISDEREWDRIPNGWRGENGDGFWIYLVPGFIDPMTEVHCIHENSPSAGYALLSRVRPCEPGCECGHQPGEIK